MEWVCRFGRAITTRSGHWSLRSRKLTIGTIKAGREPADLPGPQATAYRFTHALVTRQQVPDDLYQSAVAAFGVVDMIHLIGHYLTTSALLAAFAVPAPTA